MPALPAISVPLVAEFRVLDRPTSPADAPRARPMGHDATAGAANDAEPGKPVERAANRCDERGQIVLTDHAIVDAARSGDRAAFAELHRRYAPMVHGILLAHASPADADDLVQEVFLRAIRSIGTLREAPAVGGWLAAIARNAAVSRRRASHPTTPLTPAVESAGPHAARAADSLSAHEALDAIHQLPEAYRESLMLRLVEGLTGPQIAERLGMSEGSVRVNLCRGMKMLRQRLGWEGDP